MIEQELGQVVGIRFAEIGFADVGDREGFRDVDIFTHDTVLGVDLIGGEAVALELTEFVHRFVGSALEGSGHLFDSLHLGEMLGGFGVLDPQVLCCSFEFAASDDLECCPGVALEGLFFEVRFGLAVFAEAVGEGSVLTFQAGGGFVEKIALLMASDSGGWGHWTSFVSRF